MSNLTENETWIDKLVDELVDANKAVSNYARDYACIRNERRELEKANTRLIDTILDNTRLDYDGKELRIDSDTALIYLLKLEYPDEYRERLEDLKRELKEREAEIQRFAEEKAKTKCEIKEA